MFIYGILLYVHRCLIDCWTHSHTNTALCFLWTDVWRPTYGSIHTVCVFSPLKIFLNPGVVKHISACDPCRDDWKICTNQQLQTLLLLEQTECVGQPSHLMTAKHDLHFPFAVPFPEMFCKFLEMYVVCVSIAPQSSRNVS